MSGRRSATLKTAPKRRSAGGGGDDDCGSSSAAAAAAAAGGEGPNEFIQFLLRCLAEYPHLVAWRPEGGLIFKNLEDRFQPVLASAGYSTKIATFVRNLNYHSFSKIKSDDETLSVFKHALFVQGRMDLISMIRRTTDGAGKSELDKTKDVLEEERAKVGGLTATVERLRSALLAVAGAHAAALDAMADLQLEVPAAAVIPPAAAAELDALREEEDAAAALAAAEASGVPRAVSAAAAAKAARAREREEAAAAKRRREANRRAGLRRGAAAATAAAAGGGDDDGSGFDDGDGGDGRSASPAGQGYDLDGSGEPAPTSPAASDDSSGGRYRHAVAAAASRGRRAGGRASGGADGLVVVHHHNDGSSSSGGGRIAPDSPAISAAEALAAAAAHAAAAAEEEDDDAIMAGGGAEGAGDDDVDDDDDYADGLAEAAAAMMTAESGGEGGGRGRLSTTAAVRGAGAAAAAQRGRGSGPAAALLAPHLMLPPAAGPSAASLFPGAVAAAPAAAGHKRAADGSVVALGVPAAAAAALGGDMQPPQSQQQPQSVHRYRITSAPQRPRGGRQPEVATISTSSTGLTITPDVLRRMVDAAKAGGGGGGSNSSGVPDGGGNGGGGEHADGGDDLDGDDARGGVAGGVGKRPRRRAPGGSSSFDPDLSVAGQGQHTASTAAAAATAGRCAQHAASSSSSSGSASSASSGLPKQLINEELIVANSLWAFGQGNSGSTSTSVGSGGSGGRHAGAPEAASSSADTHAAQLPPQQQLPHRSSAGVPSRLLTQTFDSTVGLNDGPLSQTGLDSQLQPLVPEAASRSSAAAALAAYDTSLYSGPQLSPTLALSAVTSVSVGMSSTSSSSSHAAASRRSAVSGGPVSFDFAATGAAGDGNGGGGGGGGGWLHATKAPALGTQHSFTIHNQQLKLQTGHAGASFAPSREPSFGLAPVSPPGSKAAKQLQLAQQHAAMMAASAALAPPPASGADITLTLGGMYSGSGGIGGNNNSRPGSLGMHAPPLPLPGSLGAALPRASSGGSLASSQLQGGDNFAGAGGGDGGPVLPPPLRPPQRPAFAPLSSASQELPSLSSSSLSQHTGSVSGSLATTTGTGSSLSSSVVPLPLSQPMMSQPMMSSPPPPPLPAVAPVTPAALIPSEEDIGRWQRTLLSLRGDDLRLALQKVVDKFLEPAEGAAGGDGSGAPAASSPAFVAALLGRMRTEPALAETAQLARVRAVVVATELAAFAASTGGSSPQHSVSSPSTIGGATGAGGVASLDEMMMLACFIEAAQHGTVLAVMLPLPPVRQALLQAGLLQEGDDA